MRFAVGDRRIRAYALAVGATLVALALTLLMARASEQSALPLLLVAVAASALYGGWRPALVAIALCTVAASYFVVSPPGGVPATREDIAALSTFVLSAIALAAIVAGRSRLERSMAKALTREAEARQDLEMSTENFKALFEFSPIGLIVSFDPECRHMAANATAATMLGALPGENISKSAPHPSRSYRVLRNGREVPASDLPMQRAAAEGVPVSSEVLDVVRADGTRISMIVKATPLFDRSGSVRGALGGFVDITEHRRVEQALQEADRRKDEFLAMLAHELRNPLAPIRNAVEILRFGGPTEPRLESARQMIDRQVTHMARLIDDLLDVSRLTRGKIVLRKERLELADVVAQAIETVRPLIDEKGHVLEVSLPAESVAVEGDAARLMQVLANLLANAAKFTTPGGPIRLSVARSDGEAVIRVKDEGAGIAAELLPRVFDLFVQESMSLDRRQGGLGIGLTLVRTLVELHGGRVAAQSRGTGQGSEFIVHLPALGDARRDALPLRAEEPSAVSRRQLRILVVEDNRDAAESLMTLLQLNGHEVRVSHDGLEALAVVDGFSPDAAFLDLGLPGLDGYEVARRLRATPVGRSLLLVALSGYGQEEDKRRAAEAGFDHHLTKPIDFTVVERLLAVETSTPLAQATA